MQHHQLIRNQFTYSGACFIINFTSVSTCACFTQFVHKGGQKQHHFISYWSRCPFITGSLTWGIWDTVLRKCTQITGCHLMRVSLEDRLYCIFLSVIRLQQINAQYIFFLILFIYFKCISYRQSIVGFALNMLYYISIVHTYIYIYVHIILLDDVLFLLNNTKLKPFCGVKIS